jgi:hypothetical protein
MVIGHANQREAGLDFGTQRDRLHLPRIGCACSKESC